MNGWIPAVNRMTSGHLLAASALNYPGSPNMALGQHGGVHTPWWGAGNGHGALPRTLRPATALCVVVRGRSSKFLDQAALVFGDQAFARDGEVLPEMELVSDRTASGTPVRAPPA